MKAAGPHTVKRVMQACKEAGVSFEDYLDRCFKQALAKGQFSHKPKPKDK